MLNTVLDLFILHLELFIGYAICVLFPLPWLSRFILDLWVRLLGGESP
jgi:hypothetical protein